MKTASEKRLWRTFIFCWIYFFTCSLVLDVNVDEYVASINKKRQNNELSAVKFPDMSWCGGSITGYFDGDDLVYIYSSKSVSFYDASTRVYFKDTNIVQLSQREHFPITDTSHTDSIFVYKQGTSITTYTLDEKRNFIEGISTNKLDALLSCAKKMHSEILSVAK